MQVTDAPQATERTEPTETPRPPGLIRHWPWLLGILLFVAGLLGVDRTVYRTSLRWAAPVRTTSTQTFTVDDIDSHGPGAWLETAVRFPASIYGGVTVFFLILIAQPAAWRRVAAGGVACLSADLLGSLLKMTVARARPNRAGPDAYLVFHPFTGFAHDAAVSFPSGEATAAFALATAVSLMYPRLRWPCYLLAAGTCAARLASGAHYLSDVAAGAMIATLVTRTLFPVVESRLNAIFKLSIGSPTVG